MAWTNLFTTVEGVAALLAGGALLLYLGTSHPEQEVIANSVFKVRGRRDRRNTNAVAAEMDPLRSPYGGPTSVSIGQKSKQ